MAISKHKSGTFESLRVLLGLLRRKENQRRVDFSARLGVTEIKFFFRRSDDYLCFEQELLAIQQQGSRAIGFFGTRNMGFMHQQLIEILSYAMVITV